MHRIAIEEHFLLRELDDYFHTLVKGVSSETFDKVLPKFWDLDAASQTWTSKVLSGRFYPVLTSAAFNSILTPRGRWRWRAG